MITTNNRQVFMRKDHLSRWAKKSFTCLVNNTYKFWRANYVTWARHWKSGTKSFRVIRSIIQAALDYWPGIRPSKERQGPHEGDLKYVVCPLVRLSQTPLGKDRMRTIFLSININSCSFPCVPIKRQVTTWLITVFRIQHTSRRCCKLVDIKIRRQWVTKVYTHALRQHVQQHLEPWGDTWKHRLCTLSLNCNTKISNYHNTIV